MGLRNPPYAPGNGVTTVGAALSGAAVAIVKTYVVPASRTGAIVRFASAANFVGGAPTIAVQAIIGGVTVELARGTAAFSIAPNLSLNPGDTIQLAVVALIAATTFDGTLSVEEFF